MNLSNTIHIHTYIYIYIYIYIKIQRISMTISIKNRPLGSVISLETTTSIRMKIVGVTVEYKDAPMISIASPNHGEFVVSQLFSSHDIMTYLSIYLSIYIYIYVYIYMYWYISHSIQSTINAVLVVIIFSMERGIPFQDTSRTFLVKKMSLILFKLISNDYFKICCFLLFCIFCCLFDVF